MIHDPSDTQKQPLITLEHVCRGYEEAGQRHVVLHDVHNTLYHGEIVVIMGKSGSGKSTLLNLLSGIDVPDSGDIWINGQSLPRLSERQRTLFRRHTIGFIFQFFNLVSTLTVNENLLLPLELNGIKGPPARERVEKLLTAVGLLDRGNTYPDRLSGGEQQRVAIVRALVHNPSLVLADEPTGNLDSETSQNILHVLVSLTREAGRNLIMVTHSQDVAEKADRVFRLHDGRLVETEIRQPSGTIGG